MEVLTVLEQKIVALVNLAKSLQQENSILQERVEVLQNALLVRNEHAEERNQELAIAQVVVDELIQSIDSVLLQVHQEQAPGADRPADRSSLESVSDSHEAC